MPVISMGFRARAGMALAIAGLLGARAPATTAVTTSSGPYFQNLSFNSLIDINRGASAYLLDDGTRFNTCCAANVRSIANGGANSTISVRVRAPTTPATQFVFLGYGADSAGQNHLVLALDSAFSGTLVGKAFSSVFAGYDEASLIDALIHQYDGTAQSAPAVSLVTDFEATLFGQNAGFAATGTFGITSFSNGTAAGSGTATVTPVTATPMPEPLGWTMMIVGMGAVGVSLRRRGGTPAIA